MKFLQINDKKVLKEIKKTSQDTEIVEITSAKQFYDVLYGVTSKKYLVTVNCSAYKVHIKTDLKSKVIDYLKHGNKEVCVKMSDSWYKLADGSGFIYRNLKYLSEKEL